MLPYPATHEDAERLKREYAEEQKRMKKIYKMHKLHGVSPGNKCGDCKHFARFQFSNVYRKCLLYGNTSGPATDWKAGYQACGKWEAV